jgi:hypothetical protein
MTGLGNTPTKECKMTKAPYTKLSLFEFAVLYHPADATDDATERRTELIVEPKSVMAKDLDHATLLAARAIPDSYVEVLDRCEVLVRPF